jgi:hypothetical protein
MSTPPAHQSPVAARATKGRWLPRFCEPLTQKSAYRIQYPQSTGIQNQAALKTDRAGHNNSC